MTFHLLWWVNLIMFILYFLSWVNLRVSPHTIGYVAKKKSDNNWLVRIGIVTIEISSFLMLALPFIFLLFNVIGGIILIFT